MRLTIRKKRLLVRSVALLTVAFILLNGVAALQAYRFTHFTQGPEAIIKPEELSLTQKLLFAVSGVPNPRPINKAKPDLPYKTVRLRSNKSIESWYIPLEGARGTVIIFHGYKGDKSSMLDKAAEFRKLGYNTMVVDFMGSGGSEGNQTTIGFKEAEDVLACFRYIKAGERHQVLLFGTSMGAAAIMKCLHDNLIKPDGIILECPFGTMSETVQARFRSMNFPSFPMASLLMFWGGLENGFWAFSHNPADYAEKIHVPVLLMYGAKDERVSMSETKEIFERLVGPKQLHTFPGAGHENYLSRYHPEWVNVVRSFTESIP